MVKGQDGHRLSFVQFSWTECTLCKFLHPIAYTVQEIIKLTFDCQIMPVLSGVKCPLLLKIMLVANFIRIQQT